MRRGSERFYLKFPILRTKPINSPQMVILNHYNNSIFYYKHLSSFILPPPHGSTFGFLSLSHQSLIPFLSSPGFVAGSLPAGTRLCAVWGPSQDSMLETHVSRQQKSGFWRQAAPSFNPTPTIYNGEPFMYALTSPHLSVPLLIKRMDRANNLYYVG